MKSIVNHVTWYQYNTQQVETKRDYIINPTKFESILYIEAIEKDSLWEKTVLINRGRP